MRGKAISNIDKYLKIRITPAYAGKRNLWCRYQYNHRDHPRLCGEKELEPKRRKSPKGSPPPMRGKVFSAAWDTIKGGITPAYAGKSLFVYNRFLEFEDHPRLCGEKIASPCTVTTWSGSPPPMRGKVSHSANSGFPVRITPAYAGKSAQSSVVANSAQDHPRLCGEKLRESRR